MKTYRSENLPTATPAIGEYEKDDEKMPLRPTMYPEFDPIYVTIGTIGMWAGNTLNGDTAARNLLERGKLYDAEYAENGDLIGRWDFINDTGGAVLEITCQKACGFLPVYTVWRKKGGNSREDTVDNVDPSSTATTKWSRSGEAGWVPDTVLLTQESPDGSRQKWSLAYKWDLDEATVARLPGKSDPDWRAPFFEIFGDFLN